MIDKFDTTRKSMKFRDFMTEKELLEEQDIR